MNNQPQVPEQRKIDRHVTKMNELCQRMDRHIADLEELNTRLDEEFYKSSYGMYRQKKQIKIT
jgi:uncharacterized membrane protein YjjP (DUF1212 family)